MNRNKLIFTGTLGAVIAFAWFAIGSAKDENRLTVVKPGVQEGASGSEFSEHMHFVEQEIHDRQWNLAATHLQIAHSLNPANQEVIDKSLIVAENLVDELLLKDRHSAALQQAQWAIQMVAETKGGLMQGKPCSLAEIHDSERKADSFLTVIQSNACRQANKRLRNAEDHANQAWHWYKFNDRNQVRAGLKQLCWISERLEFMDGDVRGEYFRIVAKLQNLVSKSEWDSIVASAGFQRRDPTQLASNN